MADVAPFTAVLAGAPALTPSASTLADYKKSLTDGKLTRDTVAGIYRYHQTFVHNGKTITRKSFIARLDLRSAEPGRDEVSLVAAPSGKVADELAELDKKAGAHLGAPLAIYRDRPRRIDELFEETEKLPPLRTEHTADGSTHRLWRLDDPKLQAKLIQILSAERVYIVDGQARYEAMLALASKLAGGQPAALNSGLQFAPMAFCNLRDEGLVTTAIHRCVSGIASFDRREVLMRAREFFTISEGPLSSPAAVRSALLGQAKRGPTLAMIVPGHATIAYLRLRGDLIKSSVPALAASTAIGDLDTTLLGLVLEEILALDAGKQAKQVTLVDTWDAAFELFEKPTTSALFLLNPTSIEQMCAVADEGKTMPPNVSRVVPEVPNGIAISPLDKDEIVEVPSLY